MHAYQTSVFGIVILQVNKPPDLTVTVQVNKPPHVSVIVEIHKPPDVTFSDDSGERPPVENRHRFLRFPLE